jgi:hypothetical protein
MAIHKSSQAWVAPAAGYESVIPKPKHKLLEQMREVVHASVGRIESVRATRPARMPPVPTPLNCSS